MKKSILACAILAGSLSSNLMAEDTSKFYIGAGISSGAGEEEYSSGNVSMNYDYDNTSAIIKFGMKLENNNRVEISYETIDIKFDQSNLSDSEYSGLNVDWISTYPSNAIAPYWSLGLGSYTYEDTAQFFTDNEDLTGLSFNFGAGVLFNLSDSLELDLAYKGKIISWEDASINNTTVETTSTHASLYAGLNLKF